MATRKELIEAVSARYRAGSTSEKARILDEFVAVSGYHRKHAIRVLGSDGEHNRPKPPRNRLYDEAHVRDASVEVLPYVSAHMYMTQKNVPSEVQEKFWDEWPKTLNKIVDRCEKNQLQMFYAEVLVPALDGAMPTNETVTAASQ